MTLTDCQYCGHSMEDLSSIVIIHNLKGSILKEKTAFDFEVVDHQFCDTDCFLSFMNELVYLSHQKQKLDCK